MEDIGAKIGQKFFVDIEGDEYPWQMETISAPEIRELGNLPADLPVIEVMPDNTERTLQEGEIVALKPGHRFGKKIRFKRGMTGRVEEEVKLLRQEFPNLEYREEGRWIRIPRYRIPSGIWTREETEVCFQVPDAYPGQPPYAFYVPAGLLTRGTNQPPSNYGPAATPFPGAWGRFSWQQDNWRATADLRSGHNLLNFVRTFVDRFKEGA